MLKKHNLLIFILMLGYMRHKMDYELFGIANTY